jgi:hypothetical protein
MTIDKVESNYNDKQYITSYYTIHDTLYDMSSNGVITSKTFTFDATDNVETINNNKINNFDRFKTYYTTTPSGSSPIIVDVDPEGVVLFRDNTGDPVSSVSYLYSQIFEIEDTEGYDPKKHYYRINYPRSDESSTANPDPNVNYTIKGNVIVFNNIKSGTTVNIEFTKYTRKHDKDKTYFHGAEDGLFMHENKKRSVANAMNEDIKVMIRQNEQMMVLGGITLATLVVGAYVILRN